MKAPGHLGRSLPSGKINRIRCVIMKTFGYSSGRLWPQRWLAHFQLGGADFDWSPTCALVGGGNHTANIGHCEWVSCKLRYPGLHPFFRYTAQSKKPSLLPCRTRLSEQTWCCCQQTSHAVNTSILSQVLFTVPVARSCWALIYTFSICRFSTIAELNFLDE